MNAFSSYTVLHKNIPLLGVCYCTAVSVSTVNSLCINRLLGLKDRGLAFSILRGHLEVVVVGEVVARADHC